MRAWLIKKKIFELRASFLQAVDPLLLYRLFSCFVHPQFKFVYIAWHTTFFLFYPIAQLIMDVSYSNKSFHTLAKVVNQVIWHWPEIRTRFGQLFSHSAKLKWFTAWGIDKKHNYLAWQHFSNKNIVLLIFLQFEDGGINH
jgi:hypothetical protein